METNKKYMIRCLQLARLGAGSVAPNPMVGSVIVYRGKIIGEGFHKEYGGAHAEVNAINAVSNPEWLKKSTLYVTLEPCAHHGHTPPCADLIIEKQIPRVVIGSVDPFSEVAGKGIERLRKAGIEVEVGVLEQACRELNRRFFTFHEKMRPYIILKWAQTLDGFIDKERTREDFGEPVWITGDLALQLVHKIRSEESAVMVGTRTVEKDNPSLTVRRWAGNNPIRIVIDRTLRLPETINLFDKTQTTLVFNELKEEEAKNIVWIRINFDEPTLPQIMSALFKRNILSVIIEGGRQLLESFLESSLWDEAHVFIGNKFFLSGVAAPRITGEITTNELLDSDRLIVFKNPVEKEDTERSNA